MICKFCEEEGVGEWQEIWICQQCFEDYTGNSFFIALEFGDIK